MKKQIMTLGGVMLLSTMVLAGCEGDGYHVRNRDVGTVIGGVGGGVLGSAVTGGSTAGAIAGTLGGAYVGRQIGKSTEH